MELLEIFVGFGFVRFIGASSITEGVDETGVLEARGTEVGILIALGGNLAVDGITIGVLDCPRSCRGNIVETDGANTLLEIRKGM